MSSLALSTAITSLNAAQAALSVVGNNIANANTPGYSRQRVTLSTLGPSNVTNGQLTTGRGVQIGSLDRVADSLLNERLRYQASTVGRYAASASFFTEIEGFLREPGGLGLSAGLSSLFSSFSGLSADPSDPSLRDSALRSSSNLAEDLRSLDRQLRGVDRSLTDAIRTEVSEINALSSELFEINQAIGQAFTAERTPLDLLDRQDLIVRQLAERTDVSVNRGSDGRIRVSSGNTQLVSPSGFTTLETRILDPQTGRVEVLVAGGSDTFRPNDGRLRGLLDVAGPGNDERFARLDALASNLALEVNRVFSTGIPASGGFTELTSGNRVVDGDRDGSLLDETLAGSGLPFQIQSGRLIVNVTDEASGRVTRNALSIDPTTMTVGEFVTEIDALAGVSAFLDSSGVMRIVAANGQRFDFSNRVLENGDPQGLFGPDRATVYGQTPNPFTIPAGASFDLTLNNGATTTVTFDNAVNTLEAAAAEINADLPAGAEALVVDGTLVLRAVGAVPATPDNPRGESTLTLSEGTDFPLALLGITAGTATGRSTEAVDVRFGGVFTGTSDLDLTFTPTGSGVIGSTDNLQIEVRDSSGRIVQRLDVGANYTPGDALELPDGLTVAFSAGRLETAGHQRIEASFLADSDTADILPAFGLASLFTGSTAADIDVDSRVLNDPDLFTSGLSSAPGNSANLERLIALGSSGFTGFEGRTISGEWQDYVSQIGNDTARARNTRDSQALVLEGLTERRESISGVNLDEELLALEQYQQMYQASATYLQTVQEVQDILFSLV